MPAKIDAPRGPTDVTADAAYSVDNVGGAISANFDLTAMSGYPQYGAQKTQLWVDGAAGAAIVLIDENGVTHTLFVPPGPPMQLRTPIVTIVDSGSGDVNALFEWFDGPGGSNFWNN